jgi:hypothetical protein
MSTARKLRTQRYPGAVAKSAPNALARRKMMQCLRVLGLKPGASMEDVKNAQLIYKSALADDRSPEARDKLERVEKAVRFVTVCSRQRPKKRNRLHEHRFLILSVAMLVILAVFAWFHFADALRPYLVDYEAGDVLHRYETGTRFGVVIDFEEDHLFPAGTRQDAYQIRLHPTDKEIWVAARTARTALRAR